MTTAILLQVWHTFPLEGTSSGYCEAIPQPQSHAGLDSIIVQIVHTLAQLHASEVTKETQYR